MPTDEGIHDEQRHICDGEFPSSSPGPGSGPILRFEVTGSGLVSEMPEGTLLGKYRLETSLGTGGMGVVYAAFDTVLKRRVAIKTLPESLAADSQACRRFLREAQAAARLHHPNSVSVFDISRSGRTIFIAMELVIGMNAAEFLKKSGRLSVREATRIAADACRALVAAHAAGLLHRDIKPSNLMLASDGVVKLLDFGLSRILGEKTLTLSNAQSIHGTPAWMSPEQCQGDEVSELSDLYSLGATYFTLLTGRLPFEGDSPIQVMFSHCSAPVPDPRRFDPAIPESCTQIVRRAMAKLPEDRFPNAADLLTALESVAQVDADAEIRSSPPVIPISEPHQRRQALALSASRRNAASWPRRWWIPVSVVVGLVVSGSLKWGWPAFTVPESSAYQEPGTSPDSNNPPDARSAAPVPNVLSVDPVEVGTTALPDARLAFPEPPGSSTASLYSFPTAPVAITFSPDRSYLIVGQLGVTGQISVIDLQTGQLHQVLNPDSWNDNPLSQSPGQQTGVLSLAISPNGNTLVAGIDGIAHGLWSLQRNQKGLWEVTARKSPGLVRACQFSPTGHLLAAAYQETRFREEPLEIWDSMLQNRRRTIRAESSWITAMAFSRRRPSDIILLADRQGQIRFLECSTGEIKQTLQTGLQVNAIAVSDQDRRLAVCGNGQLQIWNLIQNPPAYRVLPVTTSDAVFSADSRRLYTAGSSGSSCDVCVWQVDTLQEVQCYAGHSLPIRRLALTPDGRLLASGSDDCTVRLWRPEF